MPNDSTLTIEKLNETYALLEKLDPHPRDTHFMNPQAHEALVKTRGRKEQEFIRSGWSLTALMGINIYEMPSQKHDCIIIKNPDIAKAYKENRLSEENLLKLL